MVLVTVVLAVLKALFWGAKTPGGPPKRPVYFAPKLLEVSEFVTKPEAAEEVVPNCLTTLEAVVDLSTVSENI